MVAEAKQLIGSAVIVVVGNFNPAILHPDWFERHGVLPADETAGLFAEPIKKEIPELQAIIEYSSEFAITPDRALINFKSFLLKVTRDKVEINCRTREKFPLMVTALRKIFMILGETPITAYGINFAENIVPQEKRDLVLEKLFPRSNEIKAVFGHECSSSHIIKVKNGEDVISFSIGVADSHEKALSFKINNHFENKSTDIDFLVEDLEQNFNDTLKYCEESLLKICGDAAEKVAI